MYGWAAYHCQQYQNIECCTKNHLWKQRKVVSSSCKVVDIFVRFQPKSNFLDKCSQFLSDFNRSRIFLTNAPNFCPISTEVEFSWQMLPIFIRFLPKSNFLDQILPIFVRLLPKSNFLDKYSQEKTLWWRYYIQTDLWYRLRSWREDTECEGEEDAYGGDERTVTSNATREDNDVSTAFYG